MSVLHTISSLNETVMALPAGTIPNPPAQTPPNLSGPASDIMGYLKWGVIIVIGAAGLVAIGMMAGGKMFGHHGASQNGIKVGIGAVIGAALLPVIIPFLNSVAA